MSNKYTILAAITTINYMQLDWATGSTQYKRNGTAISMN